MKGFLMAKNIAEKRSVQFKYNNGKASSVFLVGDFNAWDHKKHEMNENDYGIYSQTLMLSPGSYQYKFLVDGQWENDPLNKMTAFNAFRGLNNVIRID
jgi:1,4-alpha-glucan branching enzyme